MKLHGACVPARYQDQCPWRSGQTTAYTGIQGLHARGLGVMVAPGLIPQCRVAAFHLAPTVHRVGPSPLLSEAETIGRERGMPDCRYSRFGTIRCLFPVLAMGSPVYVRTILLYSSCVSSGMELNHRQTTKATQTVSRTTFWKGKRRRLSMKRTVPSPVARPVRQAEWPACRTPRKSAQRMVGHLWQVQGATPLHSASSCLAGLHCLSGILRHWRSVFTSGPSVPVPQNFFWTGDGLAPRLMLTFRPAALMRESRRGPASMECSEVLHYHGLTVSVFQ